MDHSANLTSRKAPRGDLVTVAEVAAALQMNSNVVQRKGREGHWGALKRHGRWRFRKSLINAEYGFDVFAPSPAVKSEAAVTP